MILLNKYHSDMEDIFYKAVEERVAKTMQQQILDECKTFFPKSCLNDKSTFKDLILMPYPKIKNAMKKLSDITTINHKVMKATCFDTTVVPIKEKPHYYIYKELYSNVADSSKNKQSMRVRLVLSLKITVCPYCNREYINARGGQASGAQLDHFHNKDDYPFLALSLYNLIPVCSNCNRIKSTKKGPFASVFDKDMDFHSKLRFDYSKDKTKVHIIRDPKDIEVDNNILLMNIEEAYQIHTLEINNLLELVDAYKETQLEEIQTVLKKHKLSDEYMKKIIFGPEIKEEHLKTKPLSRMMKDLHKKLKIYT
jgi:hypothetical protein